MRRAGPLSAPAFAVWAAAGHAEPAVAPEGPACEVHASLDLSLGGTPVARLAVGGRAGAFLIDTGASASAVDAGAYGMPVGTTAALDAGLCRPPSPFRAEDMSAYRAPGGPQSGRIGADILSRLTVVVSTAGASGTIAVGSGRFAPPDARSFVRIDGPGDGPRDIPVVRLAIGPVTVAAQFDSGFDDEAAPGIVQVNAALLDALKAAGVAMRPAPPGRTLGCAGLRVYPRWRVEGAGLALLASDGTPAGGGPPPLLEVKDDAACGGIAASAAPVAQIGASWLGRWRTTILDGPTGAVWIAAPSASADPAAR